MLKKSFFLVVFTFLIVFSIEYVGAEDNFVSNEEVDPAVDEVNIKLMELDEKVRALLGLNGSIGSIGYLTVDEKGIIQISLKSTIKERYNNKSFEELLKWAEKENVKIDFSLSYSSDDLSKILDQIFNDIKKYYNNGIPVDLNFTISQDDIKQNIELKLDLSRKNILEEKLLQQLKRNYSDVLMISEKDHIVIPETYKPKRSNWSRLGGGIALTRLFHTDHCTTTAILHKDSRYFLLTAGHCFEGAAISPTGGAFISQYNAIVGRQHSSGVYASIDAGLIRMEGNTLTGGRYATNGVKVSDTPGTSEIFDNKFVDWSEVPSTTQLNSICKSGIRTNKTCGRISGPTEMVNFGGTVGFLKVVKTTLVAGHTDSGGPVYKPSSSGNVLVGLITGGDGSDTYITRVYDVRDLYNIFLYTTNAVTKVSN